MNHALYDNTGAPVKVRLSETRPIGSYTINLADGSPVGRVDFTDSPEVDGDRIVFHTEVDRRFGGRGLAGLLVREVLADSIRKGLTIVPVCPLFARHLTKHGDDFAAAGGRFRQPTRADVALVAGAARSSV